MRQVFILLGLVWISAAAIVLAQGFKNIESGRNGNQVSTYNGAIIAGQGYTSAGTVLAPNTGQNGTLTRITQSATPTATATATGTPTSTPTKTPTPTPT